ncbi:hypothetical protein [Tychonema sp. LEGE 07203]|uniref:hypothetical protein n=1 Tax=Tychonema sp. LEGE 07203 TaxID=1828671 RepID=UPI001D1389E8|nr:hypothetical protein [Tychonema sp. LEGE 07203]
MKRFGLSPPILRTSLLMYLILTVRRLGHIQDSTMADFSMHSHQKLEKELAEFMKTVDKMFSAADLEADMKAIECLN